MGKGHVVFLNVEQYYFPESRVECHYSLGPGHRWASTDWIGLYKVGWSSVRDYHTYVWAPVPQACGQESDARGCVHFQASYLPRSGAVTYQFVYVDGKGEVCAQSHPFTFRSPRPLDDLATLDGGRDGEDSGEEMLMVVPKAHLLQTRLEGCLEELSELRRVKEAAEKRERRERERMEKAKEEWAGQRLALEAESRDLEGKLKRSREEIEKFKEETKEAQSSHEAQTTEMEGMLAESRQRVGQLEEDFRALMERGLERESELDRMKERLRRVLAQKREEEEERKRLEARLEQSDGQLRSLTTEFQGLRGSVAQKDTEAVQLRHSVSMLTQKLNTALSRETEQDSALSEVGVLRERLTSSERVADSLRAEMVRLSTQLDGGQAELHQTRLQVARLTLQLADGSLALREERAAHARQREALCRSSEAEKERAREMSVEVQRKEQQLQQQRMEREKLEVESEKQKDCHRVQLSEARRELQELKASLRVAHKEQEQLLLEKQDLEAYARQLERRLEAVAGTRWNEGLFNSGSRPESPSADGEDEKPEALQCPKLGAPPLDDALQAQRDQYEQPVVISQPPPLSSPRQQGPDPLSRCPSSQERQDPDSAPSGGQGSDAESDPQSLDGGVTVPGKLPESLVL
ncbi:calcium-binding and coiled-coil domain-containing protein 1-like isoform X3 [Paramormyrops kingsleyae]|uniref:Calcium binding and coiled-coil domain 1b n=1 Tax=Paramormyrops kingsleyae TaxID=1676925 RepID=A0A3B3RVG8_9TELE|nr:calcium-binding and coiled-coil domain-containing protein 1-like isoform X3 [Paramormyrops kingsleyae]